jgi:hypothetical protein
LMSQLVKPLVLSLMLSLVNLLSYPWCCCNNS